MFFESKTEEYLTIRCANIIKMLFENKLTKIRSKQLFVVAVPGNIHTGMLCSLGAGKVATPLHGKWRRAAA